MSSVVCQSRVECGISKSEKLASKPASLPFMACMPSKNGRPSIYSLCCYHGCRSPSCHLEVYVRGTNAQRLAHSVPHFRRCVVPHPFFAMLTPIPGPPHENRSPLGLRNGTLASYLLFSSTRCVSVAGACRVGAGSELEDSWLGEPTASVRAAAAN